MMRILIAGIAGAMAVACASSEKQEPCYDGQTRICCGSDGEVQGVNCSPPAGACHGEGEGGGKILGHCCPGLVQVPIVDPVTCARVAADALTCARCGDGICGRFENACNCADCRDGG